MKTYVDGLEAAANILVRRAEDLEQTLNRREKAMQEARAIQQRAWSYDATQFQLREKARLLREQAGIILELGKK